MVDTYAEGGAGAKPDHHDRVHQDLHRGPGTVELEGPGVLEVVRRTTADDRHGCAEDRVSTSDDLMLLPVRPSTIISMTLWSEATVSITAAAAVPAPRLSRLASRVTLVYASKPAPPSAAIATDGAVEALNFETPSHASSPMDVPPTTSVLSSVTEQMPSRTGPGS